MKAFIYGSLCAKGFLSEISILEENFSLQKWQKPIISERNENPKKFKKLDPHYFSILEGVILLQHFLIPTPCRDTRFWPF